MEGEIYMDQTLIGRFDKTVAQQYQEALQDAGVDLLLDVGERTSKAVSKIKVFVTKSDYPKAVDLIRNLEVKALMEAKEKAREFERRTIYAFLMFVGVFIIYVVLTHI